MAIVRTFHDEEDCWYHSGYTDCIRGDGIYYSELGRTEIVGRRCVGSKCTIKDYFKNHPPRTPRK